MDGVGDLADRDALLAGPAHHLNQVKLAGGEIQPGAGADALLLHGHDVQIGIVQKLVQSGGKTVHDQTSPPAQNS